MEETRKLFIVETRRLGSFYVVCGSWNEAASVVKKALDDQNYGYSGDREVKNVSIIREEHFFGSDGKRFFSGDDDFNKFIVVEQKKDKKEEKETTE